MVLWMLIMVCVCVCMNIFFQSKSEFKFMKNDRTDLSTYPISPSLYNLIAFSVQLEIIVNMELFFFVFTL